MSVHTVGITYLFALDPGDDTVYRVLFGRLPGTAYDGSTYILFGFSEGNDALNTIVSSTDTLTPAQFLNLWRTVKHPGQPCPLEDRAFCVFAALVGIPLTDLPPHWHATWRGQIPTGALG